MILNIIGISEFRLYQLFYVYGTDVKIRAIFAPHQDKGYAFVTLLSTLSTENIIKQTNGRNIDGCILRVNKRRDPRDKENSLDVVSLHVCNLPYGSTEVSIRQTFEELGVVTKCVMIGGHYAFIYMPRNIANQVITHYKQDSRGLKVSMARNQPQPRRQKSG